MVSITFIQVLIIFILSLLLSGLFFFFYRKMQEKRRRQPLHVVIEEATEPVEEDSLSADVRHYELFERLHTYLLTDRNFVKPELDTNVLISELATNRTYLFEAVKLATGKTLQEYINNLRLEEAKHLLATTDEVNETIAATCGYSSVRTFYRLFRSHYSMSPTSYRNMVKKQKRDFERSVT